jgi:hypothetical protein
LGWAEQAAARGDFADALSWVGVVEAIGDLIPIEYQTKRKAWLTALAENRAQACDDKHLPRTSTRRTREPIR